MEVRGDKVQVRATRSEYARFHMQTVLNRCAGSATRYVVFARLPANAPHLVKSLYMLLLHSIFLEVKPKLEDVLQWLVLPGNFLVRIKQVPAVMAHRKPAAISADVTRWVP